LAAEQNEEAAADDRVAEKRSAQVSLNEILRQYEPACEAIAAAWIAFVEATKAANGLRADYDLAWSVAKNLYRRRPRREPPPLG
jgi:hypothetical protein